MGVRISNYIVPSKNPVGILLPAMSDFREKMLEFVLSLPYAEEKKHLPSDPGIYFYLECRTGEVLYIGRSNNIRQRWYGRRDFSISNVRRVHYLLQVTHGWNDPLFFHLATMESFMIGLFAPRHNKIR